MCTVSPYWVPLAVYRPCVSLPSPFDGQNSAGIRRRRPFHHHPSPTLPRPAPAMGSKTSSPFDDGPSRCRRRCRRHHNHNHNRWRETRRNWKEMGDPGSRLSRPSRSRSRSSSSRQVRLVTVWQKDHLHKHPRTNPRGDYTHGRPPSRQSPASSPHSSPRRPTHSSPAHHPPPSPPAPWIAPLKHGKFLQPPLKHGKYLQPPPCNACCRSS